MQRRVESPRIAPTWVVGLMWLALCPSAAEVRLAAQTTSFSPSANAALWKGESIFVGVEGGAEDCRPVWWLEPGDHRQILLSWDQDGDTVHASVANIADYSVWRYDGSVSGHQVVLHWVPWGEFTAGAERCAFAVSTWNISGTFDEDAITAVSTQTWRHIGSPNQTVVVTYRLRLRRVSVAVHP